MFGGRLPRSGAPHLSTFIVKSLARFGERTKYHCR